MSITRYFRELKSRSRSGERQSELDRIAAELSSEIDADHRKAFASAGDRAAELLKMVDDVRHVPASRRPETASQYLFEYHDVFHSKLTGVTSDLSPRERAVVADYLEVFSSNLSDRSMYVGATELREVAGRLRSDDHQTTLLAEPWMSPFKLTRRDVRELYIHLSNEALKCGDALITAHGWHEGMAGLVDRLNSFDLMAFEKLKDILESISGGRFAKFESLIRNMEYVLACSGVRGAMARMSQLHEDLARFDPFASRRKVPTPSDITRRVVGRSWMRLSTAIMKAGDDKYAVASSRLGHVWLDLRHLDGNGPMSADAKGLLVPALSPGEEHIKFGRRHWRDDGYGSMKAIDLPVAGHPGEAADPNVAEEVLNESRALVDVLAALDAELAASTDDAAKARVDEMKRQALADFAFRQEARAKGAIPSLQPSKPTSVTTELLGLLIKDDEPAPAVEDEADHVVTVLDRIGVSEASSRSEGTAEDMYGALLKPLPLARSVMGADAIYEALQAEFPWMKEINHEVAVACARMDRQIVKHFRIAPLLLLGPVGVGKTRWIRRVCELTAVPMHMLGLSGVEHAKSVIGSERGWANARPSFATYGFLNTKVANPIFYIDELDKVAPTASHVADAFLPMLEAETSRRYPDLYLLGNLDLRYASFLFSANDSSRISSVLRSRLTPVSVRSPTADEMDRVLDTMIKEVCSNENMAAGEIETILSSYRDMGMKVYRDSSNLRDVRRVLEDETKKLIWKPRGLRLVKT
jgi:hypothetical protein